MQISARLKRILCGKLLRHSTTLRGVSGGPRVQRPDNDAALAWPDQPAGVLGNGAGSASVHISGTA